MTTRSAAVLTLALLTCLPSAHAQSPTTGPADATSRDLVERVNASSMRLGKLFPDNARFGQDVRTPAATAEGLGLCRQNVMLLRAVAVLHPEAVNDVTGQLAGYQTYLVALGDAATVAELAFVSQDSDAEKARAARNVLVRGHWMAAGANEAARAKVLDEMQTAAKADPTDQPLSEFLTDEAIGTAAMSPVGKRLRAIVAGMNTANTPNDLQMIAWKDNLDAMVGKPMVLSGKTVDGRDLSTATWRGKVVLVDFWATWCPHCLDDMPRLKKVYAELHPKGFEVLGISNDRTAGELTDCVAKLAIPWPSLFVTPATPAVGEEEAWHPITVSMNIHGIPRYFLIDKHGVCRSTDARADFEAQIARLLSE